MSDPVIILGDSPYLCLVEREIPHILYRNYSIGINNVIAKFQTMKHIFVDRHLSGITNCFPNIDVVTVPANKALVRKNNIETISTFTYDFEKSSNIFENEKLAWCGFTHDYAISYCIHNGYNNIILLGAADFEKGPHYTQNSVLFKCSDNFKENSKKFIETICTKYARIRTCNPSSYLDVERIDIEDLLK